MKRILIIDGQMLQTDAWYRGMGKYLLQVLSELNRHMPPDTEVALLCNDTLNCDKARFETIKFLYPNITQTHVSLPIPTGRNPKAKEYKAKLDAAIKMHFPEGEKFFLLSSLFLFDFFAVFPEGCRKLLLFYDLTPLLFWRDLGGYFSPELYMKRFRTLYEADHLFAISETTRKDLLAICGLNPADITNINGGFTKIAEKTIKPKGFPVPLQYVLFPTGNLPHKNNQLAVEAFTKYSRKHDNQTKLLITSHFSAEARRQLLTIDDQIVFTDNVSDEELEWLYEHAEAILFASKYEGLGLPILDAVANNKPIIASKIPVFEEMSRQAFYYFDPESSDDLAAVLGEALGHAKFQPKVQHYPELLQKYTWANTTARLTSYVSSPQLDKQLPETVSLAPKPHIAVAGLSPGIAGQIGRLSEPLNASLTLHFTVDYYFDGNGQNFREMERPTFLDAIGCKVFDIAKLNLTSYKKYDALVYLLDSAAIPSRLAQRAAILPGLAIVASFDGLDYQGQLFQHIVLSNQSYLYQYQGASYSELQHLTTTLLAKVIGYRSTVAPASAILKTARRKRRIGKQRK